MARINTSEKTFAADSISYMAASAMHDPSAVQFAAIGVHWNIVANSTDIQQIRMNIPIQYCRMRK